MSLNSFSLRRRFPSARRARISSEVPSPSLDQPVGGRHQLALHSKTGMPLACLNTLAKSSQRLQSTNPVEINLINKNNSNVHFTRNRKI